MVRAWPFALLASLVALTAPVSANEEVCRNGVIDVPSVGSSITIELEISQSREQCTKVVRAPQGAELEVSYSSVTFYHSPRCYSSSYEEYAVQDPNDESGWLETFSDCSVTTSAPPRVSFFRMMALRLSGTQWDGTTSVTLNVKAVYPRDPAVATVALGLRVPVLPFAQPIPLGFNTTAGSNWTLLLRGPSTDTVAVATGTVPSAGPSAVGVTLTEQQWRDAVNHLGQQMSAAFTFELEVGGEKVTSPASFTPSLTFTIGGPAPNTIVDYRGRVPYVVGYQGCSACSLSSNIVPALDFDSEHTFTIDSSGNFVAYTSGNDTRSLPFTDYAYVEISSASGWPSSYSGQVPNVAGWGGSFSAYTRYYYSPKPWARVVPANTSIVLATAPRNSDVSCSGSTLWLYSPESAPSGLRQADADVSPPIVSAYTWETTENSMFSSGSCEYGFFAEPGRNMTARFRSALGCGSTSSVQVSFSARPGGWTDSTPCSEEQQSVQSPTGMVVFRVTRGYSVRGPVSMAAAPPSRGYGVRVADIASPIVGAEPLPLTFVAPEPAALEGKDIIFRLRRVDTITSSGNGTLDIVRFTFSQHQAWNRTWARPDASIATIASTLERVRLLVVDGDGGILEESQPFRHSSALADPALYPGAALVLGRSNAVNLTVAGGIFENQTMMLSPVLLSTPDSTPTTSDPSSVPLGSMWLSAEGEARGVTPTLSRPGSGYVFAVRAFVGGHRRNLTAVARLFVVDEYTAEVQCDRVKFIAATPADVLLPSRFGTGSISDGPDRYTNNMDCRFHLVAPAGYKVYVRVISMNIEFQSSCAFDDLRIYPTYTSSSRSNYLAKLCGRNVPSDTYESFSNDMSILFDTDGSVVDDGFTIQYWASLSSDSGGASSGGDTGGDTGGDSGGDSGGDTGGDSGGDSGGGDSGGGDSGGDSGGGASGGGSQITPIPVAPGLSFGTSSVTVLSSGGVTAGSAFSVQFTVDGSVVSDPLRYTFSLDCDIGNCVVLGTDPSERSTLRVFRDIVLLSSRSFSSGTFVQGTTTLRVTSMHGAGVVLRLAVVDRSGVSTTVAISSPFNIAHFYSSSVDAPPTVTCQDSSMRVIAVARASNTTQQDPAPIYLQSNPQGTSYPNGLKCSFLLIAPRYNYINLNFERFAVESGTNCPYDSLQIYTRQTLSTWFGSGAYLEQLCGPEAGRQITTSESDGDGDMMVLYFSSDSSVNAAGYKVEVTAQGHSYSDTDTSDRVLVFPTANLTLPDGRAGTPSIPLLVASPLYTMEARAFIFSRSYTLKTSAPVEPINAIGGPALIPGGGVGVLSLSYPPLPTGVDFEIEIRTRQSSQSATRVTILDGVAIATEYNPSSTCSGTYYLVARAPGEPVPTEFGSGVISDGAGSIPSSQSCTFFIVAAKTGYDIVLSANSFSLSGSGSGSACVTDSVVLSTSDQIESSTWNDKERRCGPSFASYRSRGRRVVRVDYKGASGAGFSGFSISYRLAQRDTSDAEDGDDSGGLGGGAITAIVLGVLVGTCGIPVVRALRRRRAEGAAAAADSRRRERMRQHARAAANATASTAAAPAAGAYAPPPIPEPSAADGRWACPMCTYRNARNANACHMCGSRREGVAPAANANAPTAAAAGQAAASYGGVPNQGLSFTARMQSFAVRQANTVGGNRVAWTRRQDSRGRMVWVRDPTADDAAPASGSGAASPATQQQYVRTFGQDGRLDWVHASQARGLSAQFDLAQVASMPFRAKLEWFRSQTARGRIPWAQGHVQVRVRRSALVSDSVAKFAQLSAADLRKTFRFKFIGEPGLDAGGLTREWYLVVTQAVFNSDFGLFTFSHTDNLTYQINPTSGVVQDDHLPLFYFVGRFLGKALFDQQIVPAHIARPLYKHLLGMPVSFSDLEFVDGDLHRNLRFIVENDGVENLMLDFTVTESVLGEMRTIELKPGGADIEVTDANKHEYIELRVRHRLFGSIKDQLEALLRGFYEIVPPALISPFDFQELELLMCGLPEIDVADWEQNTVYRGCRAGQPMVRWFWTTIHEMSHEQRARLLQFVTGTSRVPVQGFRALQGSDGQLKPFCIQAVPASYEYPRAHTCFNRIDLPRYSSLQDMRRYLHIVIQMELTGFGME